MADYDFEGWATKNDIRCTDGRTIRHGAFIEDDGAIVPMVWNHQHNDPTNVLGHALLENRKEGVYAYCTFNNTAAGQDAKELVEHGDITSLSIYANQLQQTQGGDVLHGRIRELSLVLAGANPGASIESIVRHGDMNDDEGVIYAGSHIVLAHGEENEKETTEMPEENELIHAEEPKEEGNSEETVQDVFDTLTDKQKQVVYAIIGQALEDAKAGNSDDEGEQEMKHNVFDQEEMNTNNFLSHSDQESIIKLAKAPGVGSFQDALSIYAEQNQLAHGEGDAVVETMGLFDDADMARLFPEYQLIDPKQPKIMYDDDSWVAGVINGVKKSPIARVRTRRADARKASLDAELTALGYKKAEKKKLMGRIKLLGRTHDAQTVYVKDALNRDDILDITDFDVVAYQWQVMRHTLEQTIAQTILIGDGRDETDPDKIHEDKIRPIYGDDELYTIYRDVDVAAMKTELQGSDTTKHFGDNYVYAEAIIQEALYAREKYKGAGNLTFYCTPHLVNVMLLARDMNGRRIYSSKNDLVAALNVKNIQTIEQFEGITREDEAGNKHKLLGLFVNLSDYQLGCVKGGEITKFDQFDIDFNQQKMLMETRLSGALVEPFAAIALEEPVTSQSVGS